MGDGGANLMVFYNRIDSNTTDGRRTAERLLKLREALQSEIPQRGIAGSLVLASWNIREFDSTAYGARKDEPLYYIAEIIDHFDLVAVQEVRDDLTALERLMDLLGWWWTYLLTDVTVADHLPMWIELKTDFGEEYLKGKAGLQT